MKNEQITQLIRGSSKLPSIVNIEYCKTGYWIAAFIFVPIALIILVVISVY